MRKLTFKCDACGKSAEGDPRTPEAMPKGWQTLAVTWAHGGVIGAGESDGGAAEHELCGECCKAVVKALAKPAILAKAA